MVEERGRLFDFELLEEEEEEVVVVVEGLGLRMMGEMGELRVVAVAVEVLDLLVVVIAEEVGVVARREKGMMRRWLEDWVVVALGGWKVPNSWVREAVGEQVRMEAVEAEPQELEMVC